MVVAITSFTTDPESGLPVVVRAGEQFQPDHELVRTLRHVLLHRRGDAELGAGQMRTRRHHGHHPQ